MQSYSRNKTKRLKNQGKKQKLKKLFSLIPAGSAKWLNRSDRKTQPAPKSLQQHFVTSIPTGEPWPHAGFLGILRMELMCVGGRHAGEQDS